MLAYLRSGANLHAPMGPPSSDLLSGERDWSINGHGVWCDGLYFWRGDTADYVERYHLALPQEFLQRGVARNWQHDERHQPFLLQRVFTERELLDADHTTREFRKRPFEELWEKYQANEIFDIPIERRPPAPRRKGPTWTPFDPEEIQQLDEQADLLDLLDRAAELRCPICTRTSVRFFAYPLPPGPPRHPQDLEPERPPSAMTHRWCRYCRHFVDRIVPSEGRTFNDPLPEHVEPDRLKLVRNNSDELFPELDTYWERGLLP